MSATPLIDPKNYTVNRLWHDEWRIYQEIEGKFDTWNIKRNIEWRKDSGKIGRDYIKIWRDGWEWYSVDVDARGSWDEPIESYEVRFSGHGALDIEKAELKIEGFNIALTLAKALNAQLLTDESKAPQPKADDDFWTDLITGDNHRRGGAK